MANNSSATKTRKNPFDEGQVLRSPDRACIGRVASVGEGKPRNDGRTISWPVEIETIGAVPGGKARAYLEFAPFFLEEGFHRDEFVDSNEDGAFYDKIFEENLSARKSADKSKPRGVPALLGLCGCDYDRYIDVGDALKAAYAATADKTFEALEPALREALAAGLTDVELGFWQVQGVKYAGEDAEGKSIWERTQYFNIRKPRFEKSAWFKPDADGRKRILDRCASSKVNEKDGLPWIVATFDESTAF